MKSYEQLAQIFNKDVELMKTAFDRWCYATSQTAEQGDKEMFNLPERIAYDILRMYF